MKKLAVALCLVAAACVNGADTEPREGLMKTELLVAVGERTFEARLYDTPAGQELLKRLPLILTMRDLNGNEKYADLSQPLPRKTLYPGRVEAGELMLFGGNTLVLFYESLDTLYGYTPLGRMVNPDGLAQAARPAEVTVRLIVSPSKK